MHVLANSVRNKNTQPNFPKATQCRGVLESAKGFASVHLPIAPLLSSQQTEICPFYGLHRDRNQQEAQPIRNTESDKYAHILVLGGAGLLCLSWIGGSLVVVRLSSGSCPGVSCQWMCTQCTVFWLGDTSCVWDGGRISPTPAPTLLRAMRAAKAIIEWGVTPISPACLVCGPSPDRPGPYSAFCHCVSDLTAS